jgi:hypothetical protein
MNGRIPANTNKATISKSLESSTILAFPCRLNGNDYVSNLSPVWIDRLETRTTSTICMSGSWQYDSWIPILSIGY